ncbi:MAG: FecR family protein [Hydrogenophaga sp.]|uniref:FecR family protein n=1 Tax=Hydrogenophaga sp. TaxID=1904254 RepID=UPI002725E279|nr:FecR family protein [Hydrogenophaga sp.]MDO9569520.1 FecR family protein [Hydrogenophaga sp.]MDP1894942.1 FecR family protein [Hydrogenophaga sp.]MDP2222607.1 FecR family protein [Hydrogenophaga sp.]MDP3374857.1 FecR family protein [Hydrogenophaga sp.]MDP3923640.1 FecR family protein [Hydrogenophaga sp.]
MYTDPYTPSVKHTHSISQHRQGFYRTRLARYLRALMLIACVGGLGQATQAAAANTVVEAVQLPAWVERQGQRSAAQPGQQLRDNDKAITADGARMLLRLQDRSVIKLGEKTQLQIDAMAVRQPRGEPSSITSSLRLITGVFRYATDYTSKALGYKRELNLQMATATLGIRGTDFWSMTDAEHDAVCVFDGSVAVVRDAKPEIVLDKPGAFWVVFTGQPEQPAGQATPDQLAKFIGQAEMKQGSGILLQGGRWRTVAGVRTRVSEAVALRLRLQTAGYPAVMVSNNGRHEVRINQLATREDAEAVLARLQANPEWGVTQGRVVWAAN